MRRHVYKSKEVFRGVVEEIGLIVGMIGIFGCIIAMVMR